MAAAAAAVVEEVVGSKGMSNDDDRDSKSERYKVMLTRTSSLVSSL